MYRHTSPAAHLSSQPPVPLLTSSCEPHVQMAPDSAWLGFGEGKGEGEGEGEGESEGESEGEGEGEGERERGGEG